MTLTSLQKQALSSHSKSQLTNLRPLHSRGLFLCDEFNQASVVSDQYDIDLLSCLHRVNAYQLSQNSTTLSCGASGK